MFTAAELLAERVDLKIESLNRIYLNGHVPSPQVGGQLATFMTAHLGQPIPSPAIFRQIGDCFRAQVRRFSA